MRVCVCVHGAIWLYCARASQSPDSLFVVVVVGYSLPAPCRVQHFKARGADERTRGSNVQRTAVV